MNKSELVSAIAEKSGLSKADAEKALNACTESIKEALAQGDSIQLIGFGTYSVGERTARTGRNPQTGQEIQIAAKKVIKFKAGKALDEAIQ
jgi:nucleoid DNA-binding protein